MTDIDKTLRPVILFDGVCNLCSSIVQFVIRRDAKNVFVFASLQSAFGQSVLQKFALTANTFNSFILYKNGKIYTRSTGALMVAKQLSGAWPLLYFFIVIPAFIRNAVYNFVANHRYKWFGKKDACYIPPAKIKVKFLD